MLAIDSAGAQGFGSMLMVKLAVPGIEEAAAMADIIVYATSASAPLFE